MTPDERIAYRAQIDAEHAAADRERAAGYFGTPRGIADLPRRQWRSRAGTAVAVVLIVIVAIAAAMVAKGLAS